MQNLVVFIVLLVLLVIFVFPPLEGVAEGRGSLCPILRVRLSPSPGGEGRGEVVVYLHEDDVERGEGCRQA